MYSSYHSFPSFSHSFDSCRSIQPLLTLFLLLFVVSHLALNSIKMLITSLTLSFISQLGVISIILYHLPPSLLSLSFEVDFDQPVNHLPFSLKLLRVDSAFNHPIDHLPPSLTHLIIAGICPSFNHPINNLPHSLIYANFARRKEESKTLNKVIPQLTFDWYHYNKNVEF